MFYIGYLVFQFPFGYLLQHFPTGRLLSLTIIAWGAVLITTPACTSFAGIATNRFFLGALESAINPGEPILIRKGIFSMGTEGPGTVLRAWYCPHESF